MTMYLAESAGDADLSGVMFVAWIALVLAVVAWIALFIVALVSILMSSNLTFGGKLLWLIAVFVFPFVGTLVWFVWGRGAQLSKGW